MINYRKNSKVASLTTTSF